MTSIDQNKNIAFVGFIILKPKLEFLPKNTASLMPLNCFKSEIQTTEILRLFNVNTLVK